MFKGTMIKMISSQKPLFHINKAFKKTQKAKQRNIDASFYAPAIRRMVEGH